MFREILRYQIFCATKLTHWGRVMHICVSELTIIGSDNGLSPGQCQAIIWNNAGLLLIELLGANFSEVVIGIQRFSFQKMHILSQPQCVKTKLNKYIYISRLSPPPIYRSICGKFKRFFFLMHIYIDSIHWYTLLSKYLCLFNFHLPYSLKLSTIYFICKFQTAFELRGSNYS